MQQKIDEGWVYGEVKNADEKTHPCIVPFDQLPIAQQKKDAIFRAIVKTLAYLADEPEETAEQQ